MPEYQNAFLRELSAEQLRLLEPIEAVELEREQVLYRTGDQLTHLFFLEGGLGSMLRPTSDGQLAHVWCCGSGGRSFLGAHELLYAAPETLFEYRIRIPGRAYRISRVAMRNAMARDERLRAFMDRIIRALNIAMVQMLVCLHTHSVEQRAARQLLMLRYALRSDRLPLTRQALAQMVPTQREYLYPVARKWGGIVTFTDNVEIHDAAALERLGWNRGKREGSARWWVPRHCDA